MQTSVKAFNTQLLHISKHVAMTRKQSESICVNAGYFWFLRILDSLIELFILRIFY